MSYEGYIEYICKTGHYFIQDCYSCDPEFCPICGNNIQYYHSVDTTNGEELNEYSNFSGKCQQIAFEDICKDDHYGNKYVIRRKIYKPIGPGWKLYKHVCYDKQLETD